VLTAAVVGCAGAMLAIFPLRGPSTVVPVAPGMRLLGLSRGVLTWMSPTCGVWHARLEGGHAAEPPGPLLSLGECPADDPRFDGEVVYLLGGVGLISRHAPDGRTVLLKRSLAYALALDAGYLYVANCNYRRDCRIERLPADGTGRPELMQAGILALANMEVDGRELYWVDRGSPQPECESNEGSGSPPPGRCTPPVPPRLMAAPKNEPRAVERVVLTDFDGRRPFLGARHVYWLGAGGIHRTPKAGGADQLVLPTTTLTGFAADGDQIYLATSAGIFTARDGEPPRPLELTEAPPSGLGLDARFVYWIDPGEGAIVRRRR
jgi:hypothetical protein